MALGYAVAYRLGITPWDRAGEAGAVAFAALLDREEATHGRPLGGAVDLGCGTGAHCVDLARRGWTVTGVELVARAAERARRNLEQEHLQGGVVHGDVTRLAAAGVERGQQFFLDVGCFHGLHDDARARMGRAVTEVAAPGATLLMFAFRPGRRGPLPRGADEEQVRAAFPGWDVLSVEPADSSGMPGPLKSAAPRWYRLAHRG